MIWIYIYLLSDYDLTIKYCMDLKALTNNI